MQTLIMNLETLLSSFKDALSAANYDAFTNALTVEVTQRFEKVILKSTFNRVSTMKCLLSPFSQPVLSIASS